MVIFWVVLGLITLMIFIMAIDKNHHKISIKEQQAIKQKEEEDLKEQGQRVYTKHNGTIKAEKVSR